MQFLDLSYQQITHNLALDEALLHEAEDADGPPLLRIWESPGFAIVLGASGRIGEDVRRDLCEADLIPLARRSSGGGTVVVGPGALNFTVVLPINFDPKLSSVDTAQKFVLSRSAEGFNRFRTPEAPTIEVLGSGDLTIGRRKCSGSAQRRLKKNLLIHASMLYNFPLDRIERYLQSPRRQPEYREGRSHNFFVTNYLDSRANLVQGLRSAWDAVEEIKAPGPMALKFAEELVESRFGRSEWIERL